MPWQEVEMYSIGCSKVPGFCKAMTLGSLLGCSMAYMAQCSSQVGELAALSGKALRMSVAWQRAQLWKECLPWNLESVFLLEVSGVLVVTYLAVARVLSSIFTVVLSAGLR